MKDGGIILVEGAVVDGRPEASARFYYHEMLGEDASNWWVPTRPCLRQWIECSFLSPSMSTAQRIRQRARWLCSLAKAGNGHPQKLMRAGGRDNRSLRHHGQSRSQEGLGVRVAR